MPPPPRCVRSFCRALILPTGPDPSRGVLKPDKKIDLSSGPKRVQEARLRFGGQKICWSTVIGLWGHGPNASPPGTVIAMESNFKRACSRAHLYISDKSDIVCRL